MSATTNPSFAQSFVVPENLTALSGQVSDDEWGLEYRFPASVCGLEWATVKTAGVQFKLRRVVASAVLAERAPCGLLHDSHTGAR